MSMQPKTVLFGEETGSVPFRDTALPILVGGFAGLGTGAVLWMTAVMRFGIPGWFWP